jgi:hypothetical protein
MNFGIASNRPIFRVVMRGTTLCPNKLNCLSKHVTPQVLIKNDPGGGID